MTSSRLVAIGTSWGGIDALRVVLAGLAADFGAPLVVVQHRSAEGREGLCDVLQLTCRLRVVEAADKVPLTAGYVYLAPRDYHLMVEQGSLALNVDEPVNHARPSVDVLFESVADVYRTRAVGVILTGDGADGARGLARLMDVGAITVVQDPATAARRGMPDAALLAARVDHVARLEEIAPLLTRLVAVAVAARVL